MQRFIINNHYLGYSSLVSDLIGKSDSPYADLPLSDAFYPKTLTVYPSEMMENDHVTYSPITISASAAVNLLLYFVSLSLLRFIGCTQTKDCQQQV
jgi:hypothetical protein